MQLVIVYCSKFPPFCMIIRDAKDKGVRLTVSRVCVQREKIRRVAKIEGGCDKPRRQPRRTPPFHQLFPRRERGPPFSKILLLSSGANDRKQHSIFHPWSVLPQRPHIRTDITEYSHKQQILCPGWPIFSLLLQVIVLQAS